MLSLSYRKPGIHRFSQGALVLFNEEWHLETWVIGGLIFIDTLVSQCNFSFSRQLNILAKFETLFWLFLWTIHVYCPFSISWAFFSPSFWVLCIIGKGAFCEHNCSCFLQNFHLFCIILQYTLKCLKNILLQSPSFPPAFDVISLWFTRLLHILGSVIELPILFCWSVNSCTNTTKF